MFETLLQKFNIDRSSLNSLELETLNKWSSQLSQNQLTVGQVAEHISMMLAMIERELHGYETPKTFVEYIFRGKRNKHLEARLQNYIMLRDFLTAPEKARKFVEAQLLSLKK